MAFDKKTYDRNYLRNHIVYKKLNLNVVKAEDVKILEWLERQPEGVSNYLKRLILKDINEKLQWGTGK